MSKTINVKAFGLRLKDAREKANLTQVALAEKTTIAAQTISAYEHGKKLPTLENAFLLADTLGVSVDWLLGKDIIHNTPSTCADVYELIEVLEDALLVTAEVEKMALSDEFKTFDIYNISFKTANKILGEALLARQNLLSIIPPDKKDSLYSDNWRKGMLEYLKSFPPF